MSKQKSFFELLFDSKAKVKILKFLFRNPGTAFNAKELAVRIQERVPAVNKEIKKLLEAGLLKAQK